MLGSEEHDILATYVGGIKAGCRGKVWTQLSVCSLNTPPNPVQPEPVLASNLHPQRGDSHGDKTRRRGLALASARNLKPR